MNPVDPEFDELTRDLDVNKFWEENQLCLDLSPASLRSPLAFTPDDHWLFGFWDIHDTKRYYFDKAWRDELHRRTNLITQRTLGCRFFDEDTWQYSPKRIENLFGCEFTYTEDSTPWLTPVTDTPAVFDDLLDRAETTDLQVWALSDEYRSEWESRKRQGKDLPLLGSGSRGPATIMTSVLRPETFFLWSVDEPGLLARFSRILAEKMIEFNQLLRAFSGNAEPGWSITDDNSALFNRRLYRQYCYPVLEKVLDTLAPGDALRYQHSDSAMGHLLELQRDLGITACNYGPTLTVALIRSVMPRVIVHGQVPPSLLRGGSPQAIRAKIRQDWEEAGEGKDLLITTAGSTGAGTSLGRMRWMMKCVQEITRR